VDRPRFSPKAPRFSPKAAAPPKAVRAAAERAWQPPVSTVRQRPYAPRPTRVRPQLGRRPSVTGVIALGLVLVGLFAVAAGLGQASGFTWPSMFSAADEPPPREFPVLDPSRPTRLEIPSIGVSAPVLSVGLAGDGSVDVPPLARHNEAGWFDRGPTPGQFGPAVIVGHADTRTGPSVFFALGKLRPGQRIEVQRRDRRTAVFRVTSVEHFDKDDLPVDRVYGDYSRPGLRLVTCGGTWQGGRTGYSDNVVVFASLVDSVKT
jgi:hypothetical protein